MEIINYEYELIDNLYERYNLNNNINHKNLNEYYIFNYIRYIKKTHDLIKNGLVGKNVYNKNTRQTSSEETNTETKQTDTETKPNTEEKIKTKSRLEDPEPKPEPEPEPKPEPEPEPDPNPEPKPEPKPIPKPVEKPQNIDIHYRDKYMVKIYKKCLMKCHPDKTKITFRHKLFLLLQKSYENEEFYIIILIANYLNISINIQQKHVKVYDFFLNYIIHKYNVSINR